MEESKSGMMGHKKPYETTNPNPIQKTKTKKKPDGTKFRQSEFDPIFNLVKLEDDKVHIVIGNNIVSRKSFKTFKEADWYISIKPYEILINVACLIINTQKNETTTETKEIK